MFSEAQRPSYFKQSVYIYSTEGRTINPTNPADAEGREVIPKPQSPEYEYEAPMKSRAIQQTTLAPIIECVAAVNSMNNTEEVCEEVQAPVVVVQQYDPNEASVLISGEKNLHLYICIHYPTKFGDWGYNIMASPRCPSVLPSAYPHFRGFDMTYILTYIDDPR